MESLSSVEPFKNTTVCPLLVSGLAEPEALSLPPVQLFDLVLMLVPSELVTFPPTALRWRILTLSFPCSQLHLDMPPSDPRGNWVIWSNPGLGGGRRPCKQTSVKAELVREEAGLRYRGNQGRPNRASLYE